MVGLDDPEADNPALVRRLVEAGANIQFVGELRHSLEDVYLRLLDAAGWKREGPGARVARGERLQVPLPLLLRRREVEEVRVPLVRRGAFTPERADAIGSLASTAAAAAARR